MGLRGGAKRPRGTDGINIDQAQRVNDAKDEYHNLIVLTDPLIQHNAQLQKIVKTKNANTLLASVSADPFEGFQNILRTITVSDLQTISEGLAGTNGDMKVDHITRVLFAQDMALISSQEKACKNLRLLANQAYNIAVLSGFANDSGIIDFKSLSKALMDIIIEKGRSNGTDDMHT